VKKLAKYVLKYWFEHGGTCLWSVNDNAKFKFDYDVPNEKLLISKALVDELNTLEAEYHSYLNWDEPKSPSPWTPNQKNGFKIRANVTYIKLLSELGNDFEVINDIESCLY
jgi:hypothetical protein